MSRLPPTTFASLLRRHRQEVGLTQEELAERARLSVQAIGALERGDRRAPRKETIDLLAEALSLTEPDRALFYATARHRGQAEQAEPGETGQADATSSASASEGADDTEGLGHLYREWIPSRPKTDGPTIPRLKLMRFKLGGRIGALMIVPLLVALLSGGLFLRSAFGPPPRLCGGALAIAADFPTSGLVRPIGKPAENAVDLAVAQNHDLGGGYTLNVVNYDDALATGDGGDPARGASNVTSMVKNACIVGMVGPLGSDVAQAELPITAVAGLAMISPSNTNPGLTLRPYESESLNVPFAQMHPVGKTTNYFRNIANDAFQMTADADFTFERLAAHRVYVVVSRPSKYGDLLVGGFTSEFLAKGGTIVATDTLEWHDPGAFPALAAKIAATAPDAVYFGGIVMGGGATLKQQLVQHGYTGPFVAGDGIAKDPTYIAQAGADAAQNTFATLAEPDVSTFTTGAGARFLRDYRAKYPGEPVNGDGANAYDAAMIEITAIKNLIQMGHAVTRPAMIDQIQKIQYTGVAGPIRFDKDGDDVLGAYTVYTVQDGAWVVYDRVAV